MRSFGPTGWRRGLVGSVIVLLLVFGFKLAFPRSARAPAAAITYKPETLSSETQAWLRTTISEGKFLELRWPDFSDYSKHVNKFYEFNGYALWWTRAQEPTPQARQFITLLEHAEKKALSPEDYDSLRWRDRLAKLKPITKQPTELDAAKFDLALTVCAMRYISDLHIGRVNPKRVAFFIDDEPRKLDLAEFLKEHVVNAPDLSGALAQVEPPYPVYHRTIQALQNYIEFAKEDDGEQLPAVKKAIAPGQPYAGRERPCAPLFGLTCVSTGVPLVTVKPLLSVATSVPVRTVTVRAPLVTDEDTISFAIAVVELRTVTGPNAPAAAPPTPIPGPNDAWEMNGRKWLKVPLIVTTILCPGAAVFGVMDWIIAGGSIDNDALFLLEKVWPACVVPATETK